MLCKGLIKLGKHVIKLCVGKVTIKVEKIKNLGLLHSL